MNIEELWTKALKETDIIRSRVQALTTLGDTAVPYILLSESSVNVGDTVVRKGQVTVQKPTLIVPPNNPQFSGFEFEQGKVDDNFLINFLIIRGVAFPSLRYDNRTSSLDVFEGKISEAVKYYQNLLQQEENVQSGLVTGPEDCWQFSLLIFIGAQIVRNADYDIKKLLEEYHRKREREKNE